MVIDEKSPATVIRSRGFSCEMSGYLLESW